MKNCQDYFSSKAAYYDDVDNQPYWVFSDELLWNILKQTVLPQDRETNFSLLDAGAGTGRWSLRLLEAYPYAKASLVDLCPDMLEVAKNKIVSKKLDERAFFSVGDLTHSKEMPSGPFDLIFCFHNVIGFCSDPYLAIKNIYHSLAPGGTLCVMFPSYYHAIYFCNANGRYTQYNQILLEKKVQYNDLMPPLQLFTFQDIHSFSQLLGCHSHINYGFPTTVYPGMEETFIHGSTKQLSLLFEDSSLRQQLLEEEKELCLQPELSARGNNLLTLFKKC